MDCAFCLVDGGVCGVPAASLPASGRCDLAGPAALVELPVTAVRLDADERRQAVRVRGLNHCNSSFGRRIKLACLFSR